MNKKLPPFVKKFDFRGVYGQDITDRDGFLLGKAMLQTFSPRKILIGYDTREASQLLARHFVNAFSNTDIELFYLPQCPIDYVTAAAFTYDFDFSIMFTGSHNPWDWTGLLIHLKKGDSLQGEMVDKIIDGYYLAAEENTTEVAYNLECLKDFTLEIEKLYRSKIETTIPLTMMKPLKVLVDIGDGSGSKGLEVLQTLLPQVTFKMINNRKLYDAKSPHIADPSEIKNMQDVIKGVMSGEFDCGFAFDSDADRVLGVDENGAYLNGSMLGSAMAEAIILAGSSDTQMGYAVDCGIAFHNAIVSLKADYRDLSVKTIPVGRSILRKMVRDREVDFAIENVGHFYMKDFFMTDSGVFSIALILYWMSINGALSTLSSKYPDGIREQKFVPLPENQSEIMDKIEETFVTNYGKDSVIKSAVDGLRFEMYTGKTMQSWFATRKSGYEPIQKYFYGSLDDKQFENLKNIVTGIIAE